MSKRIVSIQKQSSVKALYAHGWQKQDGQEVHEETRTYRSPQERMVNIYRVAKWLEKQTNLRLTSMRNLKGWSVCN